MPILFLDPHYTNIVHESWFVPANYSGAILGDHPKIARAVLHLRWNLVRFQLLTLAAAISRWAHSLSTVGRHYPLHPTKRVVVTRPSQHQTLVEHWLGTTVANLLLNLVCDVQGSTPNLNLGQMSLET